MSNSPSPAYLLDLDDVDDIDSAGSEPQLPSYTRRPSAGCSTVLVDRRTRNFTYKLAKSLARPGVSLTISGDSRLSKALPSFMEGDKVAGAVRISVNSGEDIRSISVSVKGQVMTGRTSDGVFTFLNLHDTLWTAEIGDLQAHRDPTGEHDYSWPFSLALPREVVIPSTDGLKERAFPLPHTFMESGVPARVYYELEVSVKQSKWKRNRRVSAQIAYFQGSQSSLRARDLEPGSDDVGAVWKKLNPITVTGSVSQFQQRAVELGCTLSLKESSFYTRGSSIPLRLQIRSQDRQALELLSSPDAIVVHLNRRISYKDVQMCGGSSSRWSSVVESVGVATWGIHEEIPSEASSTSEGYSSTLVGKLKLKRGLVPSASIANLSIDYYISLYPFSSPVFQPYDDKSVPLISRNIQINTDLSVHPDDLGSAHNSCESL